MWTDAIAGYLFRGRTGWVIGSGMERKMQSNSDLPAILTVYEEERIETNRARWQELVVDEERKYEFVLEREGTVWGGLGWVP